MKVTFQLGILVLTLIMGACQQNQKSEVEQPSKEATVVDESTPKGSPDLGPNFNPVNSELAYYSYVGEDQSMARIFVSDIDGGNVREVSSLDTIGFHTEPKWSRDGKRIGYTNFLGEGARIMAVDADGQHLTELATVTEDGFHMFSSWDLSGEGYFFFHWPKGGFTPDAYYAKGDQLERLTENGKTNRPQMTADGHLFINRIESADPYVATKQLYDLQQKEVIKDMPELEGEFIAGNYSVKAIENEDSTTFILEDLQGNDLQELGTVPYKKIMFSTIDNRQEYVAYNTDFADGAEIHLLNIQTGEIIKLTKN